MLLTLRSRIASSKSVAVTYSAFEYMTNEKFGGAIYILCENNCKAEVSHSLFHTCLTENEGGAIFMASLSSTLLINRSCFDTCTIFTHEDETFGNAIYCKSNTLSGCAEVNQTIFFYCGPNINTSSDSTMYFNQISILSSSANFTSCHSFGGACSVGLYYPSGKLIFMQASNCTSLHITVAYVSAPDTFEIEFSNIINWTQSGSNKAFWINTGSNIIKDSALFLNAPLGNLGSCVFSGLCYGNFNHSGLSATDTTEVLIPKVRLRR